MQHRSEVNKLKIGIIQASSQKDKNTVLENCMKQSVSDENEIINFGIYPDSTVSMSYIETALCISILLESSSVDFIVTGCSSGQGMMLACNSLPGVICGYTPTVSDAYLFGRINDGNAVSYPLGLGWGWSSEINLKNVLQALFCEPFGTGYPEESAHRKIKDTMLLKSINYTCKRNLTEILPLIDPSVVQSALNYEPVYGYVISHGKNKELTDFLKQYAEKL